MSQPQTSHGRGHLVTAAQILWINLLTDGLPALALAFDRTPGVMQQKPRPADSPLLGRASVAWGVSEVIARFVWRNGEAPGR
jgi:magnesium-transporting ATPase (P-type)